MSAYNTASERAGVCGNFNRLGIASTYAWQLYALSFHACFEAYLEDRWYLFDTTHLAPTNRLIRIGSKDCRYCFNQDIWCYTARADGCLYRWLG